MEKSQRTVKILDMPVEDSLIGGKIEKGTPKCPNGGRCWRVVVNSGLTVQRKTIPHKEVKIRKNYKIQE